eukprot:gnl/Spiro4/29358_TR14376_c0_g1_i1.p1 gnl/Spiro4/29358_TR14376_c0_g1~~gnl/Spiro4/29358_TR14376_c0_g1_i1.p1  ORF type:complete len:201 (+),score=46.93 gnl/Spiro4/29358_TR14376_c0_g1_i1:59-604(+)
MSQRQELERRIRDLENQVELNRIERLRDLERPLYDPLYDPYYYPYYPYYRYPYCGRYYRDAALDLERQRLLTKLRLENDAIEARRLLDHYKQQETDNLIEAKRLELTSRLEGLKAQLALEKAESQRERDLALARARADRDASRSSLETLYESRLRSLDLELAKLRSEMSGALLKDRIRATQ